MPEKPGRSDVELLLRLLELFLSEPLRKARNFWRTIPDGLTFAELTEKYPTGTEGFEHIDTVLAFWETVGALLKKGLLSEELAFDTFLDGPPWKKNHGERKAVQDRLQRQAGRAKGGRGRDAIRGNRNLKLRTKVPFHRDIDGWLECAAAKGSGVRAEPESRNRP